jgi:hypothetical protein
LSGISSWRHRTIVRGSKPFFLLEQCSDVLHRLRGVLRRYLGEQAVGQSAGQRHLVGCGDIVNTGNRAQSLEEIGIERREPCLGFGRVRVRQGDVHRDDPVGPKPGIHRKHAQQAATEKRRTDKQDDRHGHLRCDDSPSDALGRRS